jgi:hypothetical protein
MFGVVLVQQFYGPYSFRKITSTGMVTYWKLDRVK